MTQLDTHGSMLIELASEICNDAVDAGNSKVARRDEAAISSIHDALDALQDALNELGKLTDVNRLHFGIKILCSA